VAQGVGHRRREAEEDMSDDVHYRQLLTFVQLKAGRAMTRLNKLQVRSSVRQQQLLTETQGLIAELLDHVQGLEDELDDDMAPGA
jgi:hypothetical protein